MFGSLNVVLKALPRVEPTLVTPAPPAPAPPPPAPVMRAEPEPAPPPLVSEPPRPAPPKPIDIPPMLDQIKPSELKLEPTVDFKVPQPTEVKVAPPPPKVPETLLKPMPSIPERTTLPPVETPVIRVPRKTPEIPNPLLQPMPSIPDRDALPSVEVPVIRIPQETPKIPSQLMQPIAPIPERATTLPPVERAIEPPPVPVQETPKAPPTALERALTPPAETTQPAPPAPADTTSRPAVPPPAAREPESLFRRPPQQPDSNYDPTKPSLDLDALRRRAGEITRAGSGNRALLPFPMPPVAKPKTKMEQAIENARKPDCATAYKDLGLLAVVPLVANEFGEGNCKW